MADTDVALAARRKQNRLLASLYAVVLALTAVMLLLLDRSLGDLSPVAWLVLGAPLLVPPVVMGLVFWARRRGVRWLQPPLAFGVDRARRRSILAAIRAGRAVDERDRVVATDLARRLVGQRWLPCVIVPLAALNTVRALTGERDVGTVVACGGFVLIVAVTPWILLDARRGRRWLARESPVEG